MKFLLDTHLLLWVAGSPERLSTKLSLLLEDEQNELFFSTVSLWEIAIKRSLGRANFQVDARVLRRELMDNDYQELTINSEQVVAIDMLPLLHKDPFDRLLIAQAMVEGITLLTSDAVVATYPGAIRRV